MARPRALASTQLVEIPREQRSPQHRPLDYRPNGAAIACGSDRLHQLLVVVAARVPTCLQHIDVRVQETSLLARSGVFREALAGHIRAHRLAAQLQFTGDLDAGLPVSLPSFHISIASIALGAVRLLPHLVQGSTASVTVDARERQCGWYFRLTQENLWPQAMKEPLYGLAKIAQDVPAVSNLSDIRRTGTDTTRIFCRAITCHKLHLRVGCKPGSNGRSAAVGQTVHDRVGLAVGQDGAVDPALPEGKIVAAENTGRGMGGRRGRVRPPQQRSAACCHRTASTLSRAGLTAKRQGTVTKCGIQANSTLRSGSNQIGQALGEGGRRARRIEAPKTAHMQHQARASPRNGQVSRVSGVVAMNARGAGRTIRTSCSAGGWRHRERNAVGLTLNVQHRHGWCERCQPPPACSLARNKCTHSCSIANAPSACQSTGDAEDPKLLHTLVFQPLLRIRVCNPAHPALIRALYCVPQCLCCRATIAEWACSTCPCRWVVMQQ